MNIGVMMFVVAIMALVQISIWQIFPVKLRDILMANPIFAFIVNLAGSGLIAAFTGAASLVGICNMGASVVFGIYAFWYAKHHHIVGLGVEWYKVFYIIPIFPKIVVMYKKSNKEWFR